MAQMTLAEVERLAHDTLTENGCDKANAGAITRTIVAAERDGSHSHGLFRLAGYVKSLRSGKVKGDANPQATKVAASVIRVDGDGGFAPLAQERGLDPLAELAKETDIAVCGLTRIHHFAALWPEVEALAERGLAGIAVTAAFPYVAPPGGREALFGTNPIAFAWPRADGKIYAFDQATSAMARGDIMIHRRDGHDVPLGTGIDAEGRDTTDPGVILDGGVQLAFGGYKGAAISLMVELLAGPLIGEIFSYEAKEVDIGDGGPPVGGEFILAIDPARTGNADSWQAHGERIFAKLEAMDGVRLAGQRRHKNRAAGGAVEVSDVLLGEIAKLRED